MEQDTECCENNDNVAEAAPLSVVEFEEPITQSKFDELHGWHGKEKKKPCSENLIKDCFSVKRLRTIASSVFPFVRIMRGYSWNDLLYDSLAGLTVCIMNIPQGMAYSRLAGLPPVYGLYTSMFPALIYFFFGTSRHISIGTVVAVSLAVENAVSGVIKSPPDSIVYQPENGTYLYDGRYFSPTDMRIEITIALTLLTGIVHFTLGVLRLGFFVAFFSEEMLHGFVAGLCIHLTTSQITFLVGYGPSKKYEGFAKLLYIYADMIVNFAKVNLVLLPLSILSIVMLAVFKEKIQPIISKRVKFPVPIDLVLIIIGTLMGTFINLAEYKIETVGPIPSGMPSVQVPDVRLFPPLLVQAIVTAIIGYAETIAIAKPFALKHGYKLDSNQELIAIGISNVFSSFFNCFSCSPALSRSLVQESVGSRTQVTSLINMAGLLLVLMFIAPVFQALPNFVLAAIILVSLRGIARQFGHLPSLYRESKYDFVIWVVACVSTVLTNAMYGLLFSTGFTIVTVVWRIRNPKAYVVGLVKGTSEFQDIKSYSDASDLDAIKILRFDGPLYFVSTDHFRKKINELVAKKKQEKRKKSASTPLLPSISIDLTGGNTTASKPPPISAIQFIILDCSAITFIDPSGIHALMQVMRSCAKDGVKIIFGAAKHNFRSSLEHGGFFAKNSKDLFFITVKDALNFAMRQVQTANGN